MNLEAFDLTYLKLQRANHHIDQLDQSISKFLARRPYLAYLFEKRVGRQVTYEISLHILEPSPTDWSLILGDAVHNLKVTLDVAANAAIELCNVRPKKVYFPFGENEGKLESQIKDKLKGATPALKDLIRSFKPYYGGNESLRDLHELDIIDKHREPIRQSEQFLTPMLKLAGHDDRGRPIMDFSNLHLETIDSASSPEPVKPKEGFTLVGKIDESALTHFVVFAKKLPLSGKPVVQMLRDLSESVEGIVKKFETHFFGEEHRSRNLAMPRKSPSIPHNFSFTLGEP